MSADAIADLAIDGDRCPDFTWREIADKRTGLIRPTRTVVAHMCMVQKLRWWWRAPITATGVRTAVNNATSGGAGFSRHLLFTDVTLAEIEETEELQGLFATDLHPSSASPLLNGYRAQLGGDPAQLRAIAVVLLANRIEEMVGDANGVGLYDWGIHWDPRPQRARWDERTHLPPATTETTRTS